MTRKNKNRIIIIAIVAAVALLIGVIALASHLGQTDPHAGHNHAPGESCPDDIVPNSTPEHSHSTGITRQENTFGHNIVATGNGTYTLTVLNSKNETLFKQENITKRPVVSKNTDTLYDIAWQASDDPFHYQFIYCDSKAEKVSEVFPYVYQCKDNLIVYAQKNDQGTGYVAVVQDVFNKKAYYKTYPLPGAVPEGYHIISGVALKEDGTAMVTYRTGPSNSNQKIYVEFSR